MPSETPSRDQRSRSWVVPGPASVILFYSGISLLSAASLVLEVSLTRILSVTQGYHFAFLIVSTALLGLGSAGAYLALHIRFWPLNPTRVSALSPLLFGLTTVGAYLLLNEIPFDVMRLAWEGRQVAYFLLAYLILAVPFFFSGLTIASAFLVRSRSIGRVYFADLAGAATGAVLPLVLFGSLEGTGMVLLAAALATTAGMMLTAGANDRRLTKSAVVLGLIALGGVIGGLLIPELYALRLSPYRGLETALRYPEARLLETRWNAVSRVDLVESPATRFAPGLSLTYQGGLPDQMGITIDADQLSAITAYDGTSRGLEFLEALPAAIPYYLSRPRRVFIPNPGGGLEVLLALYFPTDHLTVTDRNPLIPEMVSDPAAHFPNRIYQDKRVKISIGHERSVLRLSGAVYDLIVISPLQSVGPAGGSIGIAEDYALTREAFLEYYRYLAPDGWLAVTRYLEPQPVYAVRLLATAIEALEVCGVWQPEDHLAVIRSWGTLTVLVKRSPILADEIRTLRTLAESRRFDIDHDPAITASDVNRFNRFPEPIYYDLIERLLDPGRRNDLYRSYAFDIRPVSDDRPFFSYVLRLDRMGEIYGLVRDKWLFLVEAGLLVPIMLLQAIGVSVLLIVFPTWLRLRPDRRTVKWARGRVLAYFVCIAMGFMWIEVSMIQRFILFLIHPVYAIAAVLASLLFFAGVGSRLTAGRGGAGPVRMVPMFSALVLLILGQAAVLPWMLDGLSFLPLWGRFAAVILTLAPLGLLMGMPFPMGMERLKEVGDEAPLAWAWAINGTTSVVAVILSALLALRVGFTGICLLAAVSYGMAGWAARAPWTTGNPPALDGTERPVSEPPG